METTPTTTQSTERYFFTLFKGEAKQTVSQVSWRQFVTLVLSTSIEQVFCQTQADHNQLELSNSIIINSAQTLIKNVQTLHLGDDQLDEHWRPISLLCSPCITWGQIIRFLFYTSESFLSAIMCIVSSNMSFVRYHLSLPSLCLFTQSNAEQSLSIPSMQLYTTELIQILA